MPAPKAVQYAFEVLSTQSNLVELELEKENELELDDRELELLLLLDELESDDELELTELDELDSELLD